MIAIKNLTEKDKGKWVKYNSAVEGLDETGKIKSWNENWIFVVYKCSMQWDRYQEYTGVATDPKDLEFL